MYACVHVCKHVSMYLCAYGMPACKYVGMYARIRVYVRALRDLTCLDEPLHPDQAKSGKLSPRLHREQGTQLVFGISRIKG